MTGRRFVGEMIGQRILLQKILRTSREIVSSNPATLCFRQRLACLQPLRSESDSPGTSRRVSDHGGDIHELVGSTERSMINGDGLVWV